MEASRLLAFFQLLEEQVQNLEYGEMEVHLTLANGMPDMVSLEIETRKKRTYKHDKPR